MISRIMVAGAIVASTFTVVACASEDEAFAVLLKDNPCDCEVVLSHQAQLGPAGDLSMLSAIVRLPTGEYLLAHEATQETIIVYSMRGDLLREVGRRGEGPGEFREVSQIRLDSDGRIHVFDRQLGRVTVLDGQFDMVDTYPLPTFGRAPLLMDSRTVVASLGRLRNHLEQLNTISNGRVTAEYGVASRTPVRTEKRLAKQDSLTFWAVHPLGYELEQWSTSGQLIRRFARSEDAFRPWDDGSFLGPEGLRPYIAAVHAHVDTVSVFLHVPRENWRDLGQYRSGADGSGTMYDNAAYETLIEVIHVDSGEVVKSATIPHAISAVLDNGWVVTESEDETGQPYLDVWEITFRDRT